MKRPASQPPLDRSPADAQPIELPSADDTVLPLREVCNPAIDSNRSIFAFASGLTRRSAFDTHRVLNALLVSHAAEIAGAVRTRGTQFVSDASRERQKRPQPAVAASGFDPFK